MSSHTSKQPWALILGASSGFGEAIAVELARAGMNIFGVHMDRRDKLPHVAEVQERIRSAGRECEFFNMNAADEEKRKECVEQIRLRLAETPGTLRVLMHGQGEVARNIAQLAGIDQLRLDQRKHLGLHLSAGEHPRLPGPEVSGGGAGDRRLPRGALDEPHWGHRGPAHGGEVVSEPGAVPRPCGR